MRKSSQFCTTVITLAQVLLMCGMRIACRPMTTTKSQPSYKQEQSPIGCIVAGVLERYRLVDRPTIVDIRQPQKQGFLVRVTLPCTVKRIIIADNERLKNIIFCLEQSLLITSERCTNGWIQEQFMMWTTTRPTQHSDQLLCYAHVVLNVTLASTCADLRTHYRLGPLC